MLGEPHRILGLPHTSFAPQSNILIKTTFRPADPAKSAGLSLPGLFLM